MRLLIDTNIIVDWLQHREPTDNSSEKVMEACLFGEQEGSISVHSLTNLFYIVRKDMDTDRRLKLLSFLSSNMVVVTETGDMVNAVLDNNDFKDFEDGLQVQCAIMEHTDYIVTRNIKDFEKSVVPAILPEDIVNLL